MSSKIIIKNVLLKQNTEQPMTCTLHIVNNTISILMDSLAENHNQCMVFDAQNCLALPSFVDMQVHLRAPGQEEKEDLYTGTKAAAKGGYTHVACMPNTRPTLDNEQYIQWINQEVKNKNTYAHVYPIAAMTENIAGKKIADFDLYKRLGVLAITDDGYGVQDDALMDKIFEQAKEKNLIVMQHCEYEHLSNKRSFHQGKFTKKLNIAGYPSSAEYKMIERDLRLVEKYQTPYHILHLSTKEGVELVRIAKKKRLPVTCEVTPHHLILCDEDIKEPYADYKMNPPLRGAEDRQALQMALADGTIDIVSTDHAPHTQEEKKREYDLAPFGIIGLEFAWPLLYTELYFKNKISLSRLIDAFSTKAREIFHVPHSGLNKGNSAQITLIANTYTKKTSTAELYSKSINTPFLNRELQGWPVLTIWDGKITFLDESFWRNKYVQYN